MILLLIVTTVTVLGVSFLCSLTEAVLLSLNPLELQVQEKRASPRRAAGWP